jgi:glutathione S-transferase
VEHEVILHNFATSPFSEKIRLIFGMKGLSWRSVEIPMILPKPDLMPLTGGYRKTPVMQIGADIYCDTQRIIRELERRFPEPGLMLRGPGLAYGLGFWADRPFFMATVPVIFAELGDGMPEEFKKDREAMSGTFSVEAMKRAAPFMRDQWRAHAGFLAEQLADGRSFLEGDNPGIADAHGYMNLWFLKRALPGLYDDILGEWPKLGFWYTRLSTIGHGEMREMEASEALEIAKATEPSAEPHEDEHDPRGLKPGMRVSIAADDYGRDPVEGEIICSNAREIAIRRTDPVAGIVAVHFPRAGFVVTPL